MTDRDDYGLELDLSVEVLADGDWWPGELRQRRRRNGVWVADVAYNRGPGMNYLATVTYDRLRLPDSCTPDAPGAPTTSTDDDTPDRRTPRSEH